MENRRDAVLHGILEATRVHRTLETQSKIAVFGGRIDVFAAIIESGADLIFKKLDGLVGAYLPGPSPGILVTTERPLAIQRYTAAHEFGHFYMKHTGSLDDDAIVSRSAVLSQKYGLNEVAADAFASELLLPEWLVNYHAERQSWTASDLCKPPTLYQLALRVGASYEATCRTLERHGILSKGSTPSVLATEPKRIKQHLLGTYSLPNWHPNVWVLTERDEGSVVYGEPNDVFIVRLHEHSGSGYVWNLDQVAHAGFIVVSDKRDPIGKRGEIGGGVERILTAKSPEGSIGTLEFEERRPWDRSDLFGHFSFTFDFRGRESGMPRAAREKLIAA
jgi:Zn-dependent peptidase ImmA (M78 family)/predicted secreted protein